jgi:4-carboxymuconolactone decarboxylase
MADSTQWERGRKAFKKVMTFEGPAEPIEGSPFLNHTVGALFGDVWAREGLSVRDRRLITLVIVTSLMQPDYIRLHAKAALANGEFTIEELKEVMLHIAYYGGWPVGTFGTGIVQELERAAT